LLENSNHNRCHTGTSITITLHYQGLIQQRRAFGSRRRLWRAPKTLECDQDLELRTKLLRGENGALVPQSSKHENKNKVGNTYRGLEFHEPTFCGGVSDPEMRSGLAARTCQSSRARHPPEEERNFAPIVVKKW